jgi:hypothetical protein
MEGKGAAMLGSGLDTVRQIMNVLEAAGVEMTYAGNRPGVHLRNPG